jgi:hypothetical protein
MASLDKTGSYYQLRGRVGGIVVSSNATTSYVKAFTPPKNPGSTLTNARQVGFATVSAGWNALNILQKLAWANAALLPEYQKTDWFGNTYSLTGRQLYMEIGLIRFLAFGTVPGNPPVDPPPLGTPFAFFSLSSSNAVIPSTFSWIGVWPPTAAAVRIRAAYVRGWGAITRANTRQIVCIPLLGIARPYNIQTFMENAFGLLPLKYSVTMEVQSISTEVRLGVAYTYDQKSTGT